MPDVVSNDDLNALAAEYVLGTLDYEERKGAAALLEVDPTFRGIVRIWERRFGDLHLMVEAVEPDAKLWQRIKPKIPGVEQMPPAIPSHADEPLPVAAATAATEVPATLASATEAPPTVPAADAAAQEPKADAPVAVTPPATAETPAAEGKPDESKPDESKLGESKPAETTAPAIAEAELKLAELAALLPVSGDQSRAAEGTSAPGAPAEPVPEEELHTHAPDVVPRGFVPPAPMSTRGTPAVVEVPVVRPGGRGWMAATLMMALIAVALAGLISAWRFIPDRLPPQLRANAVLNLTTQAKPAPKEVARPKPAPFDE